MKVAPSYFSYAKTPWELTSDQLTASQLLKLDVDVTAIAKQLQELRTGAFDQTNDFRCSRDDVLRNAWRMNDFADEYMQARVEKTQRDQENRFRKLVSLFIVAAKIAKADGRIDSSEVKVVERLFEKFNINDYERQRYVDAFNAAAKADEDIYVFARKIADNFPIETRLFIYELLWDVACADGVLVDEELVLLKKMQEGLNLSEEVYEKNFRLRASYYRRTRQNAWDSSGSERSRYNEDRSENKRHEESRSALCLEDAYVLIGGNANMSIEELKSAYRTQAKSYHPDVLRAKGIPEDLIEIANAKMIKLNDAWAMICREREM